MFFYVNKRLGCSVDGLGIGGFLAASFQLQVESGGDVKYDSKWRCCSVAAACSYLHSHAQMLTFERLIETHNHKEARQRNMKRPIRI